MILCWYHESCYCARYTFLVILPITLHLHSFFINLCVVVNNFMYYLTCIFKCVSKKMSSPYSLKLQQPQPHISDKLSLRTQFKNMSCLSTLLVQIPFLGKKIFPGSQWDFVFTSSLGMSQILKPQNFTIQEIKNQTILVGFHGIWWHF